MVFGEDAELYERARPSYPAELIDFVVDLVGAPSRCADVGCGTGKAALLLAERGVSGVGVEPHLDMAAIAQLMLAPHRRWRVDVSEFEKWEPHADDLPFDLVTSAQAWHWLDPAVRFHKVYELLGSGGWLALWWNRPDDDHSHQRRAIDRIYAELAPQLPHAGIGSKGPPDVGPQPDNLRFSPVIERTFSWTQRYTGLEWVELLRTQSDHRMLDEDQLTELLARIADSIEQHDGVYEHRYVSWLWAARRV
jgi:SAM-dependent methyltransferase